MIKPVIKWSGSKRAQAPEILKEFPSHYNTYFEPFVGGGSILYAASPDRAICGDLCVSLICLWNKIKNNPIELANAYRERWNKLQEKGYTVYYEIRDQFNETHHPEDFLFLSRTCVNGLIRFNKDGKFNNSFHLTRSGINPDQLEKIIIDWSGKIQGAQFLAVDYRTTTEEAKAGDIVYLDPPYFHTKGRYYGTIDFDSFLNYLESLNSRGVKYILSFDGMQGNKNLTVEMPKDLYKRHKLIMSGNSSFKKVMDKENIEVYESLYLNW